MNYRERLKDKKRIVIKIGSSSLTHKDTGYIDFSKIDKLARVLTNIKNSGKEVILVSSGAQAVGRKTLGVDRNSELAIKQATAAVGQAQLIMIYQKLFSEYNQNVAQILMTKVTMQNDEARNNAKNTFEKLLDFGIIPIVNENDTISTYEIQFGENDRLSALVTSLVEADLLILLSDTDGLFTDDPNVNNNAEFIDIVEKLDDKLMDMAKNSSSSNVGTGGMHAKLVAARIATSSGADMVIANGKDVRVIEKIIEGKDYGTLFVANKDVNYNLIDEI